jgi:hypothetical protein
MKTLKTCVVMCITMFGISVLFHATKNVFQLEVWEFIGAFGASVFGCLLMFRHPTASAYSTSLPLEMKPAIMLSFIVSVSAMVTAFLFSRYVPVLYEIIYHMFIAVGFLLLAFSAFIADNLAYIRDERM